MKVGELKKALEEVDDSLECYVDGHSFFVPLDRTYSSCLQISSEKTTQPIIVLVAARAYAEE